MIRQTWSWHHPDLRTRVRRIKAPTEHALELQEVVLHLRLSEAGDEAPLLTRMRNAAEHEWELFCSAALMHQEWVMSLNGWPPMHHDLEIPYPPFDELLTIRDGGNPQDVDDFAIQGSDRFPALLSPLSGIWPSPSTGMNEIFWSCGYKRADEVPPTITQALLMAIATWYENRESLQQFNLTPVIELGWQNLTSHYRQAGFA